VKDLTVSVIVPTLNRRSRLERLLRAIDRLPDSRARLEVVVAVDGSTDGTNEMLREMHVGYPLRVIEREHRGRAAARNAAIAAATGDILLFLDDDTIPTPALVEAHLRHHRADPRAAVIGPLMAPPDMRLSPWVNWEATLLDRRYRRWAAHELEPTAHEFYTGNASVRREIAVAVGAFDERFLRSEDVEFGLRLARNQARFVFEPAAVAHHEPDRSFESWMRAPYEHGKLALLFASGPAPDYLLEMRRFSRGHHALTRLLTRWTVGHRLRYRATTMLLRSFIALPAFDGVMRLKLWACSALFSLLYWQGVADETRLDAGVWRGLDSMQQVAAERSAG
jgi:GT2 family glycosyltransferase